MEWTTMLPQAQEYVFWIFISAIATLLSQNLASAARIESSVKISSIVIIAGAVLNVILDPEFMFTFDMGVTGASIATKLSQFVTFAIIIWFYLSKRFVVPFSV